MTTDKLHSVELRARDGSRAEVYLHGAHVTSWTDASGQERLFLSRRASFEPHSAIRGGIPVIFPQFATLGPLPKHGFARVENWTRTDTDVDGSAGSSAHFRLVDSAQTRAIWPHAFEAAIDVRLAAAALEVSLTIRNTGDAPFEFTGALHTYLNVANLHAVHVRGLQGMSYVDKTANGALRAQTDLDLAITAETDRVYRSVTAPLEVREPGRVTRIDSAGFPDVVLWNPGAQLTATLKDMDPDDYLRMLCVEAAATTPVKLDAGATWSGSQRLS